MSHRIKSISLIAANAVCLAVAIATVFYAIRDWPARYDDGTLSWSVTGFFVVFVGLSVLGSAATAMYLWGKNSRLLVRVAIAPPTLLAIGFVAGTAKAILTGDF